MRKLLSILALLCVPMLARAQDPNYPTTFSRGGNITTSSANCDPTACLGIGLPAPSAAVITVGVTGTFSGTLAVEQSQDGGRTFTSAGASLTSTGTTSYVIAGFTTFRVRASALASGNAGVNFNVSNAPSGGVTSGTADPTGNACSANALYVLTTSGALYTCKAGVFALSTGSGGTITGTGTANTVTKWTGTSAVGNSTITDGGAGVQIGSPTGGAQGAGTLNATALFVNGVAVSGTVTSVSGTANQIDVATGTSTPVISLDSAITFPGTFTQPNLATFSKAGAASTPSVTFTGTIFTGGTGTTTFPNVYLNYGAAPTNFSTAGTILGMNGPSGFTGNLLDLHVNGGASLFLVKSSGSISSAGSVGGASFTSNSNCSSSASPAVCGSAAAGSVAIPAGALQTLQINTTAVTANSQVLLTIDEGLGTKLGVTCNNTIATLTQPVVTARTAATSFTIEEPATTSVNPVCVSYLVFN